MPTIWQFCVFANNSNNTKWKESIKIFIYRAENQMNERLQVVLANCTLQILMDRSWNVTILLNIQDNVRVWLGW